MGACEHGAPLHGVLQLALAVAFGEGCHTSIFWSRLTLLRPTETLFVCVCVYPPQVEHEMNVSSGSGSDSEVRAPSRSPSSQQTPLQPLPALARHPASVPCLLRAPATPSRVDVHEDSPVLCRGHTRVVQSCWLRVDTGATLVVLGPGPA